LLVGGRPPVLRSAVMVCALYGGLLLRRTSLPVNAFALAWLVVALLNPADLFTIGCQLSFLAVAILYWGPGRWLTSEKYPLHWGLSLLSWITDPAVSQEKGRLDRLIDRTLPTWQRWLRWAVRQVVASYAISLLVWLAVAPLVAGRLHLISP